MKERLSRYLIELGIVFDALDDGPIEELANLVAQRQKLFVGGIGRTGLLLKAFAMRLNLLGIPTYALLEASAPTIKSQDLVLIGSGSGTTETTLAMAKESLRRSGELTAITGNVLSPLGQIAQRRISIPPILPANLLADCDVESPVQAAFEQALGLVLDAMATQIADLMGRGDSTSLNSPTHHP